MSNVASVVVAFLQGLESVIRKPVAGRCGVCGCALVEPSIDEIEARVGNRERAILWVGAHGYAWDVQELSWGLYRVRCDEHADAVQDPRTQLIQPGCE